MEEKKTDLETPPYQISRDMYRENCERFIGNVNTLKDLKDNAIILLEGGRSEDHQRYTSDADNIFRQESNFNYLFGINIPDCYGTVDLKTGKRTLYVPKLPESYEVWFGKLKTLKDYKVSYKVDTVFFTDDLVKQLNEQKIKNIYTLQGVNHDSKRKIRKVNFKGIENFNIVDSGDIYVQICETRLIKSEKELNLLRYVNEMSSKAHISVMKNAPKIKFEYQLESTFLHYIHYHGGCRHVGYTSICCCGPAGQILHYGHSGEPNARPVKQDEMLLLDMGGEYHGYCADITCSFPAGGKFTEQQKLIHSAVLDAQTSVMKAMKPGVEWTDMHRLANKVLCKHLVKIGIVKSNGKTIDELCALHIPPLFMPHGLGHLVGLMVHDVGGFPNGNKKINEPGLSSLRMNRPLKAGMVLTVEPGLYFNHCVLSKALKDEKVKEYLDEDKIKEYWNFGGVRIEDDVIVTENGVENMTKTPKTWQEIEKVIASAEKK